MRHDSIGTLLRAGGRANEAYFLDTMKGPARRRIMKGCMQRIIGLSPEQKNVAFEESVTLAAPLAEVYTFFSQCENFPRFMRNIRNVKDLGRGRSLWTARGPAGMPATWKSRVTEHVPNELIAWHTEPGALIQNEGRIQFFMVSEERTLVRIEFSYVFPLGALGQKVAHIFGIDPAHQMKEDLERVRTFFLTGRPSHDLSLESGKLERMNDIPEHMTRVPPSEQSLPI